MQSCCHVFEYFLDSFVIFQRLNNCVRLFSETLYVSLHSSIGGWKSLCPHHLFLPLVSYNDQFETTVIAVRTLLVQKIFQDKTYIHPLEYTAMHQNQHRAARRLDALLTNKLAGTEIDHAVTSCRTSRHNLLVKCANNDLLVTDNRNDYSSKRIAGLKIPR